MGVNWRGLSLHTVVMGILLTCAHARPRQHKHRQPGLARESVCWWDGVDSGFIKLDFVKKLPPMNSSQLGTTAFHKMSQQWDRCDGYQQKACDLQAGCWWDTARIKANCRGSVAYLPYLLSCPGSAAYVFYKCQLWQSVAACAKDPKCSWLPGLVDPAEPAATRTACYPSALKVFNISGFNKWLSSVFLLNSPSYYGTCPTKPLMDVLHYCTMTYGSDRPTCIQDPQCAWRRSKGLCDTKSLKPVLSGLLADSVPGQAYLAAYLVCSDRNLSSTQETCEGWLAADTPGMPASVLY